MVITFSELEPRRQLLDHGAVVTFRTSERKRTPSREPQETWASSGRGEEKIADVHVTHLSSAYSDHNTLKKWAHLSGFDSVGEWQDAISRLGASPYSRGHLYLVTLRDAQ